MPLYLRTVYSFLTSIITIDDLIKYAKDNNKDTLCICDDNMYGVMEFYTKCKLNNIKPVIGFSNKDYLLFCKNYNGYLELLRLFNIKTKRDLVKEDFINKDDLIIILLNNDIDYFDNFNVYKNLNVKETLCLSKDDLDILMYIHMLRDNKTKLDKNLYNENGYLEEEDFSFITDQINIEFPKFSMTLPDYCKVNNIDSDNDTYLKNLAYKGLNRRLNNNVTKEYQDRLDYELNVLKEMGFSNYFLVVYDYILYSKKNKIMVGPGRGSCGGSLVAYTLGITEIDPIKYNLFFERFLNKERVTLPDIDTDFEDIKRDDVINYCKNKYGSNYVCNIITYSTFGAKASLRDMARVLNVTDISLNKLMDTIRFSKTENLTELYNNYPDFKNLIDNDLKLRELYKVSKKIEGNIRHNSIHASGIIISGTDLTKLVPLIDDNVCVCGYEANYLENLGLIKMDFLGVRNYTIIKDTILDINNNLKINLDFNKIPLNDSKTYDLLNRGDTLGIFQLEGKGITNFVTSFKPKCFDDIELILSIYRPGAISEMNNYLDRRFNKTNIDYYDESLKDILFDTNGVIVYQEQIMLISRKVAGFTLGKADILRRAISKKKIDLINSLKSDFINGSINNNYSEDFANKIFDLIVKFADYGFNKSHAIGYGLTTYKMAYLKANYPVYFYKNLLNNDNTKLEYIIKELKKNNINVIKPDINLSTNEYLNNKDSIILPINILKNITNLISSKIIENRKDKYLDIFDFFSKNNFKKDVYLSIINSGLLDNLGYTRKTLYFNIDDLIKYSDLCNKLGLVAKPILKEYDEFTKEELINNEKEVFGFYISNHPITNIKEKIGNCINLCDVSKYFNRFIKTVIIVDKVKEIVTKKGDKMCFVTGSDEYDTLEFTVFPKVYLEYFDKIKRNAIIIIEGKVERTDKYQIIINKIE